ncbi:hypothetical protein, partial [Melaminivora jejuensis]
TASRPPSQPSPRGGRSESRSSQPIAPTASRPPSQPSPRGGRSKAGNRLAALAGRPLRVLLLLAAASLAPAAAIARPPTPCPVALPAQATPEQLLPHLHQCQDDPAYLTRLGRLLNTEQRYAEATEHLERAILFDPDATAAQMDYAIALAGSGDALSALQLVAALLARRDLPPEQRASLMQARARWASGAQRAYASTSAQAGLRWGFENNLLGAPRIGSLWLTLPSGDVLLPLDDSHRPRPGAYLRADARIDHTRVRADGSRWDYSLGLQQRTTPSLHEAGSTQAEAAIERSQDAPPGSAGIGHYLNLGAAVLDTRGGTRYRSLAAGAGLQWLTPAAPERTCQWRTGLELQSRALHSNPLLSGSYAGLSGQWHCLGQALDPQWRIALRAGRDTPRHADRPGGAQDEYSLRALYSQPLDGASAWRLEGELNHTRDATGYSALLDYNARRHVSRLALRAEYRGSLRPGLQWLAGTETLLQQSNLPLFSLRSSGLYLGLNANW